VFFSRGASHGNGVYLIAGFIHEAAWCYFPLVLAILLVDSEPRAVQHDGLSRTTASNPQARLLLGGGIYLAVCLCLMVATNRVKSDPALITDQQRAIMNSWREIYPAAYNHAGAVGFLGLSLRDGVGLVITHQSSAITLRGYVAAFLLGIAPVMLFLTKRKLVANQRLTRATGLCAVLAAAVPFLTAADWGRYTYLFVVQLFAFVVLATRERDNDQHGKYGLRTSLDQVIIWTMLIGLNSTMWQVKHFRQHGLSAFEPGIAFQMLSSQQSPP